METVEILDCRNVVEASFPSTLIEIHKLPVGDSPSVCFHDGFSFYNAPGELRVEFRGTVFCSLACAIACQSLSNESCITGDDEAELFFKYSGATNIPLPQIAPQRRELAVFGGGTYTLAVFRNNSCTAEPVGQHCLYDCHPLTEKYPSVSFSKFFENSIFCSFNCMLSFVLEDSSIGSIAETEIRNRVRYNLIPAGPRILLKKFGGYQEIDEFRDAFVDTFYKILPERTLISAAMRLIPLGENISGYQSHVEVHKFFALLIKPGEYVMESNGQSDQLKPQALTAEKPKPRSLAKVMKKKANVGRGDAPGQFNQAENTCVVKISSGSGKILNSSKANALPPTKLCSGKLPFKKINS